MRRIALVAMGFVLVSALPVLAQRSEDGGRPLRRARAAERLYDYVGVRVIRAVARSGLEAVATVAHTKEGFTCVRFTAPPRLAGRVSLRTPEGRVHSWPPRRQPGAWGAHVPAETGANLDLLLRNYDLVREGTARVANRETLAYLVRPKHAGNPSKRIWFDRETGLILRSARYNWEGKPASESEFREIRVARDLPEAAAQCRPPAGVKWRSGNRAAASRSSRQIDFQVAKPTYLPLGYQFIGQGTIMLHGRPAAHLRFGDGLNTISLFEQPGAAPKEFPATHDVGFSQLAFRRVGEMNVAAVGDLSREQLQRILDSLPE